VAGSNCDIKQVQLVFDLFLSIHGKFGERQRGVRVARGAAEGKSSFSRALQTSQVHPQLYITPLTA